MVTHLDRLPKKTLQIEPNQYHKTGDYEKKAALSPVLWHFNGRKKRDYEKKTANDRAYEISQLSDIETAKNGRDYEDFAGDYENFPEDSWVENVPRVSYGVLGGV